MRDDTLFKAKIREALRLARENGYTQARIGEEAGVSPQAVGQWPRSGKVSNANLAVLAKLAGKQLDWFYENGDIGDALRSSPQVGDALSTTPKVGDAVRRQRRHEVEFIGHLDAWDNDTPLGDDEVELPLFREVEVSGGSGNTQVIENHGAKLRFAKRTLRRAGVMEEHAACAYVDGDSMEPILPDGATVGVNTQDKAIKDGKMYVIDHGGLLRVKFLYRLPGGGLRIRSANPDREAYPDEDLGPDWPEQVRIIGKVFWYSVLMH